MDVVTDKALARLRAAARRYRQIEHARVELHRAIFAALQSDVPVGQVATETGYNREHIRRIRIEGDEGKL